MYDYSIVIPTLNEEKYLPLLLKSITTQSLLPRQVIVADADSADTTVDIAKNYGCTIVPGGLPAFGRNSGFATVTTPLTLFLDSDAILPSGSFIQDCIEEFMARKLDLASCFALNLQSNKFNGKLSIVTSNLRRLLDQLVFVLFKRTLGASGWFMLVRSDVIKSVGGFDTTLDSFEDLDFYTRAFEKKYKFGILFKGAYLSGRRYDKRNFIELIKLGYYMTMYKLGFKNFKTNFKSIKGNLGGE